MNLAIVSQFGESLDEAIKKQWFAGAVEAAPANAPWEAACSADVFLVNPLPVWKAAKAMPRPPEWPGRLRWVMSASAGVDAYPPWLLEVPLFTCGRGLATGNIADYIIAAVFQHSKNLATVTVNEPLQWRLMPLGRVAGSTFGLIGYGDIGKAVARRALALGANAHAFRRQPGPAVEDGVRIFDNLEDLVASADHIIVAVPATAATFQMVNARILRRAQPHAHLINISRGSVVDQDALVAALDEARLGFATLDVTDPEPLPAGHPLWTHPKVRLTPHLSSYHPLVLDDVRRFVIANLERFARGEQPANPVDPLQGY
jgi:phosphoglycerate dehydrogenase-like enzyme